MGPWHDGTGCAHRLGCPAENRLEHVDFRLIHIILSTDKSSRRNSGSQR